jgi:hypothetical protein
MTVSARGLFRATGKKSKHVAVRTLDGGYAHAEHLERETADFYPTPPEPTRAILKAESARLRDFEAIWEPACGDGAMVREIRSAGHFCIATDLVQRGGAEAVCDFFAYTSPPRTRLAMVTNPPFCEVNWRDGKGRWITHAMDVLGVEYMALILPWNWPGAAGMAGMWQKTPPARVYLMRWRIDFTGQGTPPMLNAWFVWDRKWRGETVLRTLDRADDFRQKSLL